MYNLSSAEGKKWAEICTEMTERVRRLGPNPVRKLDAASVAALQSAAPEAESEREAPSACC
jgi:hypothetical protein